MGSGKIFMTGGGAFDLDPTTAEAGDIVAPKVIVDKEGNPLTGTLNDQPSYTNALSVVQSSGDSPSIFTRIPKGAYRTASSSGQPEITTPSSVVASAGGLSADKMMMGKTAFGINGTATSDANLQANRIVSGFSGYSKGQKVVGNIPIQGPETDGDRVWATAASNWAGTINVGVRNGHYFNGVNWVRYDVPTLRPENIKKGVNVAGIVGTWEGWVPQPTDVYYRGINTSLNSYGHEGSGSGSFTAETGSLRANPARPYLLLKGPINLERYNQVNVEMRFDGNGESSYPLTGLQNYWIKMKVEDSPQTFSRTAGTGTIGAGATVTLSVSFSGLNFSTNYLWIYLTLGGRYWWDYGDDDYDWAYRDNCRFYGYVFRVWYS